MDIENSEESSSLVESESSSEKSFEVCKYCFETQSEIGELTLFRPCKCHTPICVKCFIKKHDYGNQISLTCEICCAEYSHLESFFEIDEIEELKKQKRETNEVTDLAYQLESNSNVEESDSETINLSEEESCCAKHKYNCARCLAKTKICCWKTKWRIGHFIFGYIMTLAMIGLVTCVLAIASLIVYAIIADVQRHQSTDFPPLQSSPQPESYALEPSPQPGSYLPSPAPKPLIQQPEPVPL